MTHSCRIVLNNLRILSDNSEDSLGFLLGTSCICLSDNISKKYDYSKYKREIRSIIRQLALDGFLSYNGSESNFTLTQRGLHPHQFQWDAFKSFLFKSILVPIGVSFVTTLFTLLMRALLLTP